MFGPNSWFSYDVNIDFSHRDDRFFKIYSKTTDAFKMCFDLPGFDILFIPGSGTIGIEAVMFSLRRPVRLIGPEGGFRSRWERMSEIYNRGKDTAPVDMYCQLETSCSETFSKSGGVVDAISSFPYYTLPEETKIFITCSNKQLGSFIGLSIVGVRKDFWGALIEDTRFSYLNLLRYKQYAEKNQTPSTTPTHIYQHLLEVFDTFDLEAFRRKIDSVSQKLVNALGEENIIGNKICPVITVRKDAVPYNLAKEFNLYGYWTGKSNYQFFTYSCEEQVYDEFLRKYEKLK